MSLLNEIIDHFVVMYQYLLSIFLSYLLKRTCVSVTGTYKYLLFKLCEKLRKFRKIQECSVFL